MIAIDVDSLHYGGAILKRTQHRYTEIKNYFDERRFIINSKGKNKIAWLIDNSKHIPTLFQYSFPQPCKKFGYPYDDFISKAISKEGLLPPKLVLQILVRMISSDWPDI